MIYMKHQTLILMDCMTSSIGLSQVKHYYQHNLLFADNLQNMKENVSLFSGYKQNNKVIYQAIFQIKQKSLALFAVIEFTAENQLLMIDYTL